MKKLIVLSFVILFFVLGVFYTRGASDACIHGTIVYDTGRKSDGEMGLTVGDNYDDVRVKQITDAIKSLKHIHKAGKVVLIGHSGGAAITTRIIGLYPNLIQCYY